VDAITGDVRGVQVAVSPSVVTCLFRRTFAAR
jgi:hypothetical protein